jgi:lipid A ethanolaminephosphotransferase
MAPKEQTHVPMAVWFSTPMLSHLGWDKSCWLGQASQPVTHDNLFSSMLTLAHVQTRLYKPQLDVFSACPSGQRQVQAVTGLPSASEHAAKPLSTTVGADPKPSHG